MKSDDKRATILVVDDQDDTRSFLRELLGTEGYQVVEAANGREALQVFKGNSPDAIILDLSMPVMDGLATALRIKEYFETGTHPVPIIAVTAFHSDAIRDAALSSGCSEYITKPVDVPLLMKTLRLLLQAKISAL